MCINNEHRVNVYDENENGEILETTYQHINVKYMVRCKHVFETYTTYSFNYYFKNGLMLMGLIPDQPFDLNI